MVSAFFSMHQHSVSNKMLGDLSKRKIKENSVPCIIGLSTLSIKS